MCLKIDFLVMTSLIYADRACPIPAGDCGCIVKSGHVLSRSQEMDTAVLTCAGCGKPVFLAYIKAMRKTWHADCFRCAGCGLPIRESGFKTKAGKPYHTACYQHIFAPICPTCGKPVNGESIQALRHMYHPDHFVCAACGKPIHTRQFHVHDGKPYCKADYTRLFSLICSVCKQQITGTYQLDAAGNMVCSKRDRAHRLCISCGKLIQSQHNGGGKYFSSAHSICNACLATAIDDQADAAGLFAEVCRFLAEYNLNIDPRKVPLRLVSMAELRRSHARRSPNRPHGLTLVRESSMLGMPLTREVTAILALTSLPRVHLGMVLSHEVMHTWMFTNNFPRLTPRVEEGLCELAAALWLEKHTDPLAVHLLDNMHNNRSRTYGSGFRSARKAFSKMGMGGLLDYVRKNRKFPG